MVLFTMANMSTPTNNYHISTEARSETANGTLQSVSLLTLTPVITVPTGTTPSYTSVSTVINGSVATNHTNQTNFSMLPVNLIMSDGTTNTIFDNVYTGLNTIEFMMARNQYYLMASDDVMLINVDGVKLLILETSFANQKLMNSFSFHYIRGKVRCIYRNLATIMNLTDALISVGYQKSIASLIFGTIFESVL